MEGFLSRTFHLFRRVRQGCPLSPVLFDIAIEILAIAVKGNQDICGVVTPSTNHNILLYADDVVLTLQDLVNSIQALVPILDLFGGISGYKVNKHKSAIIGMNIS